MALKRTFKIKKRMARGWIIVKCPRKECGHEFWVHARTWAESWEGTGRACPYCFVPSSLPPKKE